MTGEEYSRGLDELRSIFGNKWPKPITDRMWFMVRDLDGDAFLSIVRGISFSSVKPPTAAEIVAACQSLINDARDIRRKKARDEIDRKGLCPQCENAGWVFAEVPGKPHEFAFRCNNCAGAHVAGISPTIPMWNPERFSSLRIKTYKPSASELAEAKDWMGKVLNKWSAPSREEQATWERNNPE